MENEKIEYEDADKVVVNGLTYRRLDLIVEEHGMTLQQFRQLRLRGIKLPVAERHRKNTRGRGAEYLYDERKVLTVIDLARNRTVSKLEQESVDVSMVDRIVETYKSLGHAKKVTVRAALGITGEGAGYMLFNKVHNTLENEGTLRRVGFDGEYELAVKGAP